jgi:GTP 3',8-cyclase
MTGDCVRQVDYLRISITDRCNERCLYCLPEGFSDWKPRAEILTFEEILAVVRCAVELGFRRFRVTGGEPLVRREVERFVADLAATPGVEYVGLSTNGIRLAALADSLAAAGLSTVNVSLDALDEGLYGRITGGRLTEVLAGIEAARRVQIPSVKLNTVLMRGVNEDQIWPLIEYAAARQLLLRFIELMPVSRSDVLNEDNFFPIGQVQALIRRRTALEPDPVRRGHGPAIYYRLPEVGTTVGFIGAMTNLHFCEACNKMRLTADGKIRPCLGDHCEVDLKPGLRPAFDPAAVRSAFQTALRIKPVEHSFRHQYQPHRIMTAIGG